MSGGTQFSADAMREFMKAIEDQLKVIDGDTGSLIDTLKNKLNLEPAFGKMQEGMTASENYKTAYGSVWNDMQGLKAAYESVQATCKSTLGNVEETENNNTMK